VGIRTGGFSLAGGSEAIIGSVARAVRGLVSVVWDMKLGSFVILSLGDRRRDARDLRGVAHFASGIARGAAHGGAAGA
jgi:hypothetical protein